MARMSFIYTLITLSPIIILAIDSVISLGKVTGMFLDLASLSIYFGLFTGIYSIFKIKQEKLNGMKFALTSTIICGLLFLFFILSSFFPLI